VVSGVCNLTTITGAGFVIITFTVLFSLLKILELSNLKTSPSLNSDICLAS